MADTTKTKLITSTMAGAPVLSGTAGSLIAVLEAALVNGFGAVTVTGITVSGGIATAAVSAGHSFTVGSVALVAGAAPSTLNGEKRILSTAANSFTFDATGISDQTAAGSISAKVAAAGWQRVFSGTNITCLKPTAPEATGCVLRIDDTGTTNARVRAYEAMTDANTGIGLTPLDSQVSGGLYWPKSPTADATSKPWTLIADDRAFYLCVAPAGQPHNFTIVFAGDIASLKSGDAYGYLLTGNSSNLTSLQEVPEGCVGFSQQGNNTSAAYLVRSHLGLGGSVLATRTGAHHTAYGASMYTKVYAGASGYANGVSFPNGPNNGLLTCPLEVYEGGLRGRLPGLLHPLQGLGTVFAHGAFMDGTNDLAGRKLMAVLPGWPGASSRTGGTVFFDITGPWAR